MAKKLKEASFDLNDFLEQYDKVAQMGNINDLVSMIPGANKLKLGSATIDESQIKRNKCIIQSMTAEERSNPKVLNYSRRKRIAAGSGTTVQDVNKLIKQYEQTKDMMKRFGKSKRLPF